MSDYLKKRWIIVGIVWMATFSLTYWNFYKIESIENAREKKEIYLMDEQFWSNNASTISQILKKRASLIQEVESSKLGVFEFQNNLRSLSLKLGLNAIKLISQPEFDQDGIVPVKISFQSNFKQAMQWMIADSEVELRAARMLVYDAASKVDAGLPGNAWNCGGIGLKT